MQRAQEEVMLEKHRPQRRGDTFQAGTGQAGCTVHPGTQKQVSIAGSQISRWGRAGDEAAKGDPGQVTEVVRGAWVWRPTESPV